MEHYCKICNVTCCKKSDLDRHLKTSKHKKSANNCETNQSLFTCTLCDYKCCKKSILLKHESTTKHKRSALIASNHTSSSIEDLIEKKREIPSEIGTFSGYPDLAPPDYMTIITQLLNQNNDLKNFILEQATEHKKDTTEIVGKMIETVKPINNNTTNNNQKFNINVFLNDQCKDAINFSDFVKNIEVSREDIQNTGQLGFVNGISKILMDNLKQLSINERPIHCTDLKRETMYIKDEDKWNKEDNDTKIRDAIQTVSRKSMKTLIDWKQVNPDYEDGDSEFSQECLSMQRHSVAGDDREVYYPKVAKLVAKEVIVDKS